MAHQQTIVQTVVTFVDHTPTLAAPGPSPPALFDPATYRNMVVAEIPAYGQLPEEVARASADTPTTRLLDLGAGTGETSLRVLARHPHAALVALDENPAMLERARTQLPAAAQLQVGRLQDPLPDGPFDLVISALAVHHLDGAGKANLFTRVAAALRLAGRFALGDVIIPDDPRDAVTPLNADHDRPSGVHEQIGWLQAAGFRTALVWQHRDLVVLAADLDST